AHDADRRESYTQGLVQGLLDDGTVQLEPLTFIRGRGFARTFAILDEAQNMQYWWARSRAERRAGGAAVPEATPRQGAPRPGGRPGHPQALGGRPRSPAHRPPPSSAPPPGSC